MKGRRKMPSEKHFSTAVLLYLFLLLVLVIINLINKIDVFNIIYLIALVCCVLKYFMVMNSGRE